jgi:hypothetical protein
MKIGPHKYKLPCGLIVDRPWFDEANYIVIPNKKLYIGDSIFDVYGNEARITML